ncbi:MAG: NUDIX domain-containing protein [Planctomycetaceae bacterium]
MKVSAGTLLYRRGPGGLDVLLVHPSGGYNRRAPWGIPKGLVEAGEPPEAAARRETLEETGVAAGDLQHLGHMVYTRSRKRIECFAGEVRVDATARCASWEVDRAEFLPMEEARQRIHPEQAVFLDRLEELLKSGV